MKSVRQFLLINAGLLLVALGIFLFKAPINFVTGGVSGIAIITGHYIEGVTIGPIMMAINIVARILNKFSHIHIGKTLLIADAAIAGMSIFVFGTKIGMYSILGLVMKGFLIDTVIESINTMKQLTIVTTHTAEIRDFITGVLKRGATITRSTGAYTNEDRYVITTVVSRGQAIKLRQFVRNVDQMAFITINSTSEIIGKGFRNAEI